MSLKARGPVIMNHRVHHSIGECVVRALLLLLLLLIMMMMMMMQVMLLTTSTLDDIYHKACALAEDPDDVRDSFQHPTRLIQFLVGLRGKNEPMAIGGPWSPSLDGPNPAVDQHVLVKTAIRTTKALTGIDLSKCTQWYVISICLVCLLSFLTS